MRTDAGRTRFQDRETRRRQRVEPAKREAEEKPGALTDALWPWAGILGCDHTAKRTGGIEPGQWWCKLNQKNRLLSSRNDSYEREDCARGLENHRGGNWSPREDLPVERRTYSAIEKSP
jgi:hypothetical protein